MKIENFGHSPSHIVGSWVIFDPPKFFKKSGNLQQNVPFTKKNFTNRWKNFTTKNKIKI
jgi:hypothetical protein